MKAIIKTAAVVMIALCFAVSGGLCIAAEQSAPGKTLILYYSKTGNTRAACEALQKEIDADIQEIKDLNSREGFWAATGMLKIFMGMQTKIEPATVDFEPYERIIVSAPIWASKFGLAMRTFVERNDFEGKEVIIFITADSPIEEKYQQKHTALIEESGGRVVGHFQVHATDEVDGEKVPRSKEKIVEETLKLVPGIKACIPGKN
jgi:flavodoxin